MTYGSSNKFQELVFSEPSADTRLITKVFKESQVIHWRKILNHRLFDKFRRRSQSYFEETQSTGSYFWRVEENPARPENCILRAIYASPLAGFILQHFDNQTAAVLVANSVMRHMGPDPSDAHLRFHQDCRVVVEGNRLVSIWVPLAPEDISKSANGLELVPYYTDLLPIPEDSRFALETDDRTIEMLRKAGRTWQPELSVGDAIVFSGRCPHASVVSEHATQYRISIEIRFVPLTEQIISIISDSSYQCCYVMHPDFLYGPTEVKDDTVDPDKYHFKHNLIEGNSLTKTMSECLAPLLARDGN